MHSSVKDVPKSYTTTGLQISEIDSDKVLGGFHAKFAAGEDIVEGVAGRKSIDTSYENWEGGEVEEPASLGSGQPTPVDTDRPKYPHREL